MKYELGICSRFRDSMTWCDYEINHVPRFFSQILSQDSDLIKRGNFAFFLEEGNSVDNTYETLLRYSKNAKNIFLAKSDTSALQHVTSSSEPSRFQELSKIGNRILEMAKGKCDNILFIESDLIIRKNYLRQLYEGFEELPDAGIIA